MLAEYLIRKRETRDMKNKRFEKYFTETSLWKKIKKASRSAGTKVVYAVLLLFYVLNDKSTSMKTKVSIAAALGYFILPTDAIFDLTPLIGYSDDMGVLLFVLTQVTSNVTPEIKLKARRKLSDWFRDVNPADLQELEKSLV